MSFIHLKIKLVQLYIKIITSYFTTRKNILILYIVNIVISGQKDESLQNENGEEGARMFQNIYKSYMTIRFTKKYLMIYTNKFLTYKRKTYRFRKT